MEQFRSKHKQTQSEWEAEMSKKVLEFVRKCACYVNAVGHIISHKHKGEGMEEEGRSRKK